MWVQVVFLHITEFICIMHAWRVHSCNSCDIVWTKEGIIKCIQIFLRPACVHECCPADARRYTHMFWPVGGINAEFVSELYGICIIFGWHLDDRPHFALVRPHAGFRLLFIKLPACFQHVSYSCYVKFKALCREFNGINFNVFCAAGQFLGFSCRGCGK